jgi:hypothetical protein
LKSVEICKNKIDLNKDDVVKFYTIEGIEFLPEGFQDLDPLVN